MKRKCLVSIVMPFRNAAEFIEEAVESVLTQTYADFELIAIDDGSTDSSADIVENFKDERIKLHRRHHDFIGNLNFGIYTARGEYIARFDADDMMHPKRLEIQLAQMDTDVCFTHMELFGAETGRVGDVSGVIKRPLALLKIGNPFFHPTMMARKEMYLPYKRGYDYAEDYKLWCDMAMAGRTFQVIPEVLHRYRVHKGNAFMAHTIEQMKLTSKIMAELCE